MFNGNKAGVYGQNLAGQATTIQYITEANITTRRNLEEVSSLDSSNQFLLAAVDPYGQIVKTENLKQIKVAIHNSSDDAYLL